MIRDLGFGRYGGYDDLNNNSYNNTNLLGDIL